MVGQASWYLSQGLQMVLFPTILILILEVSPSNYGLAQVSLLAPSIFLIVLGGTIADRTDTRILLCFVHLMATAPLFLVLFAVSNIILFGGVYWSKFAHMFYKPGAAIQKNLAEADGS